MFNVYRRAELLSAAQVAPDGRKLFLGHATSQDTHPPPHHSNYRPASTIPPGLIPEIVFSKRKELFNYTKGDA